MIFGRAKKVRTTLPASGGQKWAYKKRTYHGPNHLLLFRREKSISIHDVDEIVFTIRKGEISKGYFEIWLLYLIYGLHISRRENFFCKSSTFMSVLC